MDYATIVAIVFGSIGVCGTIIICTVKITSRFTNMETILLQVVAEVANLKLQQRVTIESLAEHSKVCDTDRVELSTKLDSHERRLNKHSSQLGELGAT